MDPPGRASRRGGQTQLTMQPGQRSDATPQANRDRIQDGPLRVKDGTRRARQSTGPLDCVLIVLFLFYFIFKSDM